MTMFTFACDCGAKLKRGPIDHLGPGIEPLRGLPYCFNCVDAHGQPTHVMLPMTDFELFADAWRNLLRELLRPLEHLLKAIS